MASKICCANNHTTKAVSTWQAAVAVSQGRRIGACKKCGKTLEYQIDHVYANDSNRKENRFVVTGAVRLGPKMAGGESFDPFLLVLREIENGAEQILPTYWAYGPDFAQRGGQFPPLLSLDEWKTLFRRLDGTFDEMEDRIRVRAYELYEQHGKTPGHALDDWLQAEAQLRGLKVLRAAA
ncbi:MAG: DUF2934 domain-containing protein [Candidatus Acidiferrales bacterium]